MTDAAERELQNRLVLMGFTKATNKHALLDHIENLLRNWGIERTVFVKQIKKLQAVIKQESPELSHLDLELEPGGL